MSSIPPQQSHPGLSSNSASSVQYSSNHNYNQGSFLTIQSENSMPSVSAMALLSRKYDNLDPIIARVYSNSMKTQRNLKSSIARKETTVSKLKYHLTEGTFPTNLNFKFEAYDYPPSISEEKRNEVKNQEIDIMNRAKLEILTLRHKVLESDIPEQKAKIITTEEHWRREFARELPSDLATEDFLQYAINKVDLNLATIKFDEHQRLIHAKPTTTTVPMESSKNAVDELQQQMSELKADLAAAVRLIKQSAQQPKHVDHRKQRKNESGSGSDITDLRGRRHHAAETKRSSSAKRSKSIDSTRSTRSNHSTASGRNKSRKGQPHQHQQQSSKHAGSTKSAKPEGAQRPTAPNVNHNKKK